MNDLTKNLPSKPGVYIYKDEHGQILYVGKAKDLKKRVSSYFTGKHTDRPWTSVLVGLIRDIETIVVSNEIEALLLEATLIKQHTPRFNIKLTDDKAYPYIKLVLNEPIPRFFVTRRQRDDKGRYFGPYLSARVAQQTLEFLRRLYGIHLSPKPLKVNRDRPCLNCQLDGFACPLCGEVDEQAYLVRIDQAVDFLQGKRKNLVNDLEKRMEAAAEAQNFELAAKLRDRWQSLTQVLGHQQVISTVQDDYDAVGVAESANLAALTLLRVRDGRINGNLTFFYRLGGGETSAELIRQFLINDYQTLSELPNLVVLPVAIDEQEVIAQLLGNLIGRRLELRTAERGDKKQLLNLAGRNAENKLEMRLSRTDQSYQGVVALKELLKLDFLPNRIEAIDISNLGTSEPVGACICFVNGLPDKNEYRRYKIKTVQGQNDFAMIGEVVKRRVADTSRPAADLLMIDGGPEQLKFAVRGLENALRPPKAIISLAKKPDRIFLPEHKKPLPAKRGDKGLLLLARARDEVHRFVITFQRHRQRNKSLNA